MTPKRFAKLKQALTRRQPDLTVLADGVHKPHNISAILRTCDAVGIHRLHAVSPDGAIRRHHMMAGGSKRWVEVVTHPSVDAAATSMRAEGWQLAAAHAEQGSRDYRDIDYTEHIAVILGAELYGPSERALEHADFSIRIPMHGLVESLNVSVAAAVILFEAERQRRAAGLYDRSRLDPDEFEQTLFEWAYPDIARRCRARDLPYPPLADDGALLGNPLAGGV